MILNIGYLYGDLMNIYGDTGNIIALKKRAEWRDIKVKITELSLGSIIKPNSCDIYFFGGGQDQSQIAVSEDLQKGDKAIVIKRDVERGAPLLSICGGYQLLGKYYQPFEGPKLLGIGLFNAYTKASHDRMIGNIVIESDFGKLVGFENHSGKTYLNDGSKPLGQIVKGFGNNGEDSAEGCIYKNAIGCYMHGSLLPKNPHLADWILQKAIETKTGQSTSLIKLSDNLENQAHLFATSKFS